MFEFMPNILNLGSYDAELVHKNKTKTAPRTVSVFEIELILNDGGTSHINQNAYPVKKNNIIFAKPGQIRYTELPYKCLFIHVIVEDETMLSLLQDIPDIFTPKSPKDYEDIFTTMIALATFPSEQNTLLLQSKLLELFSALSKEKTSLHFKKLLGNKNSQVVNKAIRYIDRNFQTSLTLSNVAAHVSMSKIYFHNLFLSATGQTLHRYLLEKRLSHAKNLLLTSDSTIAEIASNCGFSSQSYMNYVFQKECQMTPKEYIKRMGELWDK